MCALKLIDEEDEEILSVEWHIYGEWVIYDMEEDAEIIGLYMSSEGENWSAVQAFGFMVWNPNPSFTD